MIIIDVFKLFNHHACPYINSRLEKIFLFENGVSTFPVGPEGVHNGTGVSILGPGWKSQITRPVGVLKERLIVFPLLVVILTQLMYIDRECQIPGLWLVANGAIWMHDHDFPNVLIQQGNI